jgi:hypothetical protein
MGQNVFTRPPGGAHHLCYIFLVSRSLLIGCTLRTEALLGMASPKPRILSLPGTLSFRI